MCAASASTWRQALPELQLVQLGLTTVIAPDRDNATDQGVAHARSASHRHQLSLITASVLSKISLSRICSPSLSAGAVSAACCSPAGTGGRMKTMGGSYHDLAALAAAEFSDARQSYKPSPLGPANASTQSIDSSLGKSRCVPACVCVCVCVACALFTVQSASPGCRLYRQSL